MSRDLAAASLDRMEPGTLLIAPDTAVPTNWRIEPVPLACGWSRVENAFTELDFDSETASKGWTFFFRAGAIDTTAYGWNEAGNVSKAIGQLASAARNQNCNCLQIDSLTPGTCLGIPRLRMAAHVRHIQTGGVFSGT